MRVRAWRPCLIALCALACDKREPAPTPGESVPRAVLPAPSASAATPTSTTRSAACRVMSVRGNVRTATGELIDKGSLLLGDRWLVLEPGASLAIKHTTSGRELAFDGPGRVLPCFGGEEEMIVGSGTVRTQSSVGVRPGATVVLGTPFGSVRYADAQAKLVVGEAKLEVPEASGDLTLVPALAPTEPVPLTKAGTRTDKPSADEALAACARAADAASERARELLSAATGTRGVIAAAHVRARAAARLTCAAATASALANGDAMEIAARLQRLGELRAQWMEVPR